jgi:hypothetical protein
MTVASFTQTDYQGYDDDGAPGSATTKAGINLDWTQKVDENFRIRYAVEEVNGKAVSNVRPEFEYNLNSEGWNNITTTSSVVKVVLSSYYADDDADNVQRVSSGGTFTGGNLDEDGVCGEANQIDFAGSDIWEIESCFQIVGADVSHGNTVEIRSTRSNTTEWETYSNSASLTVDASGVTLEINVAENIINVAEDITLSLPDSLVISIFDTVGIAEDITLSLPDSLVISNLIH